MVENERMLPLKGARNFRDFGGYPTQLGGTVKRDRLFRSGQLSRLTDAGYETLAPYDIRFVFDFRRPMEQERHPTDWRSKSPPEILLLPIFDGQEHFQDPEVNATIRQKPEVAREMSIENYGRMGSSPALIDRYRQMFARISETPDEAFLIHCSGGKDRTGVGAALILSALGVDRETIMEDYLLTNTVLSPEARYKVGVSTYGGLGDRSVEWDPKAIDHLIVVEPAYLEATFSAAEESFGSLDAFLSDGLGVTDEVRRKLADALIE